VENQNKINEQKIYEQINAIYFNILSFEGQKEVLQENKAIAERILKITKDKFNEGIAKKQELNEAEVNVISLQDKIEQLEWTIKIQYQSLNLFFENEINAQLSQKISEFENENQLLETQNQLKTDNANLQLQFAQQEYKALRYQNLPVLSFISAFNWQNLSNDIFFSNKSNNINFNYVGLKLSWDLFSVPRLSNTKSKQIQVEMLKVNALHTKKENETQNLQMTAELQKALKQLQNFQKIYALKKDTYEKNYNQFNENILPLDKLLISQNDMLLSKLNIVTTLANIGFNKNKIEINNR
jgi:OMF family outer membrane factor